MRSLSGLGIGLSLLFGLLFFALVAEVYYLLWWKKGVASNRSADEESTTSAREFLDLFCWKRPPSLTPAPFTHREICTSVRVIDDPNSNKDSSLKALGGGEGLDEELMRLHNLSGPPRILFTIKEETKEELESEEGRARRRTLSDLLLIGESPLLTPTPLSSPPVIAASHVFLDSYDKHGFNPLFESHVEDGKGWVWPSPPPTFKFLRDAEEKLYRKTLMEEALKVQSFCGDNQNNAVKIPLPSDSLEKDSSLSIEFSQCSC